MILKYNVFAVFLFIAIILVAHVLATDGYSWQENTVSDLAAQNYENRWLMKTGFILFGIVLSVGAISKLLTVQSKFIAELCIVFYGLAILVSGIYSTKPFIEGTSFSESEALVHSIAATVAGTSFCMALLVFAIKESERRLIHTGFLVFVTTFSAWFGMAEYGLGIIQKTMYAGSFVWLVLFYNTDSKTTNHDFHTIYGRDYRRVGISNGKE